jgi:hypothetical protein
MNWFIQADEISRRLTGRDRLRLISARSRNYGFIDKAFDIARDNPSFALETSSRGQKAVWCGVKKSSCNKRYAKWGQNYL